MGDVIKLPSVKNTTEELFYEYVFLLGERDYGREVPANGNPYKMNSLEFDAWSAGWWHALTVVNPVK